jgi:hypothetical protein
LIVDLLSFEKEELLYEYKISILLRSHYILSRLGIILEEEMHRRNQLHQNSRLMLPKDRCVNNLIIKLRFVYVKFINYFINY